MNISAEQVSPFKRTITVEIPAADVGAAIKKNAKKIQRTAHIRGFRKGKVPLDIILKLYGPSIERDALADMFEAAVNTVLDEEGAPAPLLEPSVNYDEFDRKKDFTFTLDFIVRPDLTVEGYEGLSLSKEAVEVTEEEITATLEQYRQNMAEVEPIGEDGTADIGHMVTGSVLEAPEGIKVGAVNLELGKHQLAEGADDQIIGMKAGEEKTFEVTLPSEEEGAEPTTGKVTLLVNEISLKKLPDLDDELAKDYGKESLEAFREELRGQLLERKEREERGRIQKAAMEQLRAKNPLEIPEEFVEKTLDREMERQRGQFMQMGATAEMVDAILAEGRDKRRESIRDQLHNEFLLAALGPQLELTASEEEIEQKMQEMADGAGTSIAKVKAAYADEASMAEFKERLQVDKAMDYLLDHATYDAPQADEAPSTEEPPDAEPEEPPAADEASDDTETEPEETA